MNPFLKLQQEKSTIEKEQKAKGKNIAQSLIDQGFVKMDAKRNAIKFEPLLTKRSEYYIDIR